MTTLRIEPGNRLVLAVFTGTIFLSASLLFFVQPLYAKIVLPKIGGASAVWTTAMLFFQAVLLIGYLYAHFVTRRLTVPFQVGLHIALWVLALGFLPLAVPEGWALDVSGSISFQTLILFAGGVGLPFAVLSANAPLIQHWYSRTNGPSAADPFFLYAASNLGSLIALLGFPLIAEPLFSTRWIGWFFAGGFFLLGGMLFWCGLTARNGRAVEAVHASQGTEVLKFEDLLKWGVLAFIPSSLMLAVTTIVSTEVGPLPLVWAVPLALYLLTFVIAFSGRRVMSDTVLRLVGGGGIIGAGAVFSGVLGAPMDYVQMFLLMLSFFYVALWAHVRMYESRPTSAHLTTFYIAVSIGGACGGLFNAVLAPMIFTAVWEGPVTLWVAALVFFLTQRPSSTGQVAKTVSGAAVLGLAVLVVQPFAGIDRHMAVALSLAAAAGAVVINQKHILAVALVVLCAYAVPKRFPESVDVLFQDRSFFGVHAVVEHDDRRMYLNGTTIHGIQLLEELEADKPTPISYYHPLGAMGRILASEEVAEAGSIGIVGVGTGALTCYATEGQSWMLYEIDPMVEYIARDSDLFTYIPQCASDAETFLGDARLVLEAQEHLKFDVLIIDAFSSDVVPVHLITLEAIQLFKDRLTEEGLLVFHISNRFFDLAPPLSRAAEKVDMRAWQFRRPSKEATEGAVGYAPSDVVAFAREATNVPEITAKEDWLPLTSDGGEVWTDDHANVLGALRFLKRWSNAGES